MPNPKKWLQNANGWQRLWFVASVLLLFYAALIHPFVAMSDTVRSSYEYFTGVKRDYENRACETYWTKPMSELTAPKFEPRRGGCWHLYNHREISKPQKLPYTFADYEWQYTRKLWTARLLASGIFSARTLILSGWVYFAGVVVAWVVAGIGARSAPRRVSGKSTRWQEVALRRAPKLYSWRRKGTNILNPKKWLQNANGWQQPWFVASVLLLLYTALIYPFVAMSNTVRSSYEYFSAVERDFENPACEYYWTKPMRELRTPKFESYGSECWYLFVHREISKPQKLPYTFADFKPHFVRERWPSLLLIASGPFFTGVLILSGLVYFAGVVVAWVVAGFRNKPQ